MAGKVTDEKKKGDKISAMRYLMRDLLTECVQKVRSYPKQEKVLIHLRQGMFTMLLFVFFVFLFPAF